MAKESKRAVIAAIAGNLAIAAIKFVAAGFTGSSAMLAEGIHSRVDTGNERSCLLGIWRSKRPPDEMRPSGFGKALYFWTLIVAFSIFGVGGGVSIYEGILHLSVLFEDSAELGVEIRATFPQIRCVFLEARELRAPRPENRRPPALAPTTP